VELDAPPLAGVAAMASVGVAAPAPAEAGVSVAAAAGAAGVFVAAAAPPAAGVSVAAAAPPPVPVVAVGLSPPHALSSIEHITSSVSTNIHLVDLTISAFLLLRATLSWPHR